MRIEPTTLALLGEILKKERKHQKLTREQAAAICKVSPSFIRDAESDPSKCSLGKLVSLCEGLGLKWHLQGLADDPHAYGTMAKNFLTMARFIGNGGGSNPGGTLLTSGLEKPAEKTSPAKEKE